ncbi:MAG: GGDEF domain-containing protein [Syntrophomonadaceae bacterium]|nr:GGDEF domain-containing protein [Syntrophomonadaceae bacterium]
MGYRARDKGQERKAHIPMLFLITSFFALAIGFYVAYATETDFTPFNNEPVVEFNSGWSYLDGSAQTPLKVPGQLIDYENDTLILSNTVPADLTRDMTLCVETYNQSIRAYIGGEKVYEYGYGNHTPFGNVLGWVVWNCIDLPHDCAGESITLEITSSYGNPANEVFTINYGTKSALVFHYLEQFKFSLLMSFIGILLGLFLVFSALILIWKRIEVNTRAFLYLGLFILLSSLWIPAVNGIMQMLFGGKTAAYMTALIVFWLIPMPLLLYIQEITTSSKKLLNGFSVAYLLIFLGVLLLYVLNIKEMMETLVVAQVLMALAMVLILRVCFVELSQHYNAEVRETIWGVLVLMAFASLAFLRFYAGYGNKQFTDYYGAGIFFFVLLLGIGALRRGFELFYASVRAMSYQRMAYVDTMTQMSNRASFNETMEALPMNLSGIKHLGFIVLDLNRLKIVNDTLGHTAGDEVIRRSSECIRMAFEHVGECFRIGGDEFAILIKNKTEDEVRASIDELYAVIDAHNKDKEIKVAMAYGYSVADIDTVQRVGVHAVFQTADAKMLKQKTDTGQVSPRRPE